MKIALTCRGVIFPSVKGNFKCLPNFVPLTSKEPFGFVFSHKRFHSNFKC